MVVGVRLAVAVGLVAAAACGGGRTGRSPDPLSATQLRARVDAVCERMYERTATLEGPEDLAGLGATVTQLLEITEQGLERLERLVPRRSDTATMTELIGLVERSNRELERAGRAATKGDDAGATKALQASSELLAEFAGSAVAAGFTSCAQPDDGGAAEGEAGAADEGAGEGAGEGDGEASSYQVLDLGSELQPIPGFAYAPLPDEGRDELVAGLGTSSEVTGLLEAIGTTLVTDDAAASLLILLVLREVPDDDGALEIVEGMTSDAISVEQGEIQGRSGLGYVTADNRQGFVSVRGRAVVIGLSDSTEHLAAVLSGLFEANPEL